jgi:hypothetical protein
MGKARVDEGIWRRDLPIAAGRKPLPKFWVAPDQAEQGNG